jgi:hypothetical protein
MGDRFYQFILMPPPFLSKSSWQLPEPFLPLKCLGINPLGDFAPLYIRIKSVTDFFLYLPGTCLNEKNFSPAQDFPGIDLS